MGNTFYLALNEGHTPAVLILATSAESAEDRYRQWFQRREYRLDAHYNRVGKVDLDRVVIMPVPRLDAEELIEVADQKSSDFYHL